MVLKSFCIPIFSENPVNSADHGRVEAGDGTYTASRMQSEVRVFLHVKLMGRPVGWTQRIESKLYPLGSSDILEDHGKPPSGILGRFHKIPLILLMFHQETLTLRRPTQPMGKANTTQGVWALRAKVGLVMPHGNAPLIERQVRKLGSHKIASLLS